MIALWFNVIIKVDVIDHQQGATPAGVAHALLTKIQPLINPYTITNARAGARGLL